MMGEVVIDLDAWREHQIQAAMRYLQGVASVYARQQDFSRENPNGTMVWVTEGESVAPEIMAEAVRRVRGLPA